MQPKAEAKGVYHEEHLILINSDVAADCNNPRSNGVIFVFNFLGHPGEAGFEFSVSGFEPDKEVRSPSYKRWFSCNFLSLKWLGFVNKF